VSLALTAVSDLARHLEAALALLAAGFIAWAAAVAWLERREASAPAAPAGAAAGLLLAALLLRLPLLALPPTLSDDLLRYLWDGKVAAAGANPYALAPDAPQLAPLRDEEWRRLAHREVATVYPPLALGAFSIAASTERPRLAWKSIAAAADLAACVLLVAAARRRRLPLARTAWYAWNPLVALETAGMGHVDALGVAAAVAAVLWLLPRRDGAGGESGDAAPDPGAGRRPALSAAAAAAGALAKLAPLAALPLWARHSRRPALYLAVALAIAAAGLLPVAAATGGVPPGLVTYGVSWEFDGPLFEPLWRLLDAAGAAPAAARAADAVKAATGRHAAVDVVYPFLYPQLLAKLLLAAAALGVVAWSVLSSSPAARDPVRGTRRLFAGLLLCSATVYPWYLLWVLPWAALERHRPWLLASATAPLAYLAQHRAVDLFPAVWLAVWGPPALAAALLALRGRRRARDGRPAPLEAR
jgi:alpha-1,6-mannosyltransferase